MRAAPAIVAMLVAGQAVGQVPATTGQQERIEGSDPVRKSYEITFETTQHTRYCKAQVWTEYLQKNTVAAVNGGVINEDCGPSSGEFTVSVRYKSEDGEVHNDEYIQQWQRDDDLEIEFESEYQMAENVDLIRVRARKISCVCTETDQATDEANKGEDQ